MASLDRQPTNRNMLSPTGFRFVLNRTPKTNYFTYSAPLPTLTLGEYDAENPMVKLPVPGDKLRYEPLTLRFRVDEDLSNYLEIHDWLVGLGFPESYDQSIHKSPATAAKAGTAFSGDQVYSDGTLLIMSSNQNVNLQITFKKMFPVSLTELNFDASLTDIEYLEATATFRYQTYEIVKV